MKASLKIEESKLKRWEVYSGETVTAPVIVRLDGRNFHRLADRCGLTKPFDEKFHLAMVETARDLMIETGMNISLAHTASDEISLLFLRDAHLPFKGRIEKILSILASYTSSSLQNRLREIFSYRSPLSFDSRIVKVNTPCEILEYFRWRCLEAFRNFLNSYAQIFIGKSETFRVKGRGVVRKMHLRGFDICMAPSWQKFGTFIYWKQIEKGGYNPITGRVVKVKRRRIFTSSIDPSSSEGKKFLKTCF